MKSGIPRGSMLDAAIPKPGDLLDVQREFLAALTPDPATARHASIALAPAMRATAVGTTAAGAAARQASLAMHAGAALPSMLPIPQAWADAAAIVCAVSQQAQGLQAQWLQGWTELAKDASTWHRPNTVTKLVSQEADLAGRAFSLVSAQVTSTVRAQEDILVGIAWWMSRYV